MNAQADASHVVEWSDHTHAFRIRTFAEFTASNLQRFFEEICDDYGLLGFFDSQEAAVRFVEQRAARGGAAAHGSLRSHLEAMVA